MGPLGISVLQSEMGPCGLSQDIRSICIWVLTVTLICSYRMGSPTHHHQWTGHQDPSCYLGSYPPITVFLTLPAFPTTCPCEITSPVPQAVPTMHCAVLDWLHCDMCLAYCKEPGGPFNHCNCCTTAISPPPLPIPLGDEIVHCMGTVSADAGGAQERSHISPIEPHNTPLVQDKEDSREDKDYNHKDPYPILNIGDRNWAAEDAARGWLATYTHQGTWNGQNQSPIPKGFVLNVHPTYIPFHLIDDSGKEIVAKYVQLFLKHDDPYAYMKMTSNSPTFIGKILAAPDTNCWEKPQYHNDNVQSTSLESTSNGQNLTMWSCICMTLCSLQKYSTSNMPVSAKGPWSNR